MHILKGNGFRYCPHCGSEALNFALKTLHCSHCDFEYFHNTASGVGAVLHRKNPENRASEVLLVVRAFEPEKGRYDLPGGFVDYGEGLEQGLLRELGEELGSTLAAQLGKLEYLCSSPDSYLYHGVLYHVCNAIYSAALPAESTIEVADDVEDYFWYDVNQLEFSQIAFQSVVEALKLWQGRCKCEYR